MPNAKINDLQSDIDELNTLLKQAERKTVQDILSLDIRKLETKLISLKENLKESPTEVNPVPTTSAATPKKRYQVKLNGYGWDQSDKYVKIFVTLKDVQNLPKDQVTCKFTDRTMELLVYDLESKDYVLTINNLLEPIVIEESHWKQKTDMVVVFLAKSRPNIKWSHMTEIEKRFEEKRNNKFKPDDMANKDPQESIMGLMKNMYETGDDEMKRMISKAWYEGQQKKKTDTIDF